jgi:hypothetical protein
MRQVVLLILRADPGVENNDPTKKDLREHQGCQENSLLEEIMCAICDYAMASAFSFKIFRMPGLNSERIEIGAYVKPLSKGFN